MNAVEALANATIGFAVSWAATWALLPFWGFEPSPSGAFSITAMFFVLSFLRAWALREFFKRIA